MEKLHVVKIGGNIINDANSLNDFLKKFQAIKGDKILVHGGGKAATDLANSMGIKQTMIDGRRVTDADTLNIAVMVYAGLISKTIVAKLQSNSCNACGFSGADNNLIVSKRRASKPIDYGFVGDILNDGINVKQFNEILKKGIVPVICSITHDGEGNLLNTNADAIASKIASALASIYEVSLVYCFEKNGVLVDVENEFSYLPTINLEQFQKLKSQNVISKGMIPKLDMAFEAFYNNVKSVTICKAQYISCIDSQLVGTQLV